MSEPWRYRCPKGHASISGWATRSERRDSTKRYRCSACRAVYEGDPYDAAVTEFPVDEEPIDQPDMDAVLAELVRICDQPRRAYARAREFDAWTPKQVGHQLQVLEDCGYVRRASGSSRGHHWQPTEIGRRRVHARDETETMDARAHLTPIEHGLLTLFGAILLGLAVAIANGVVVG